MKLGEGHRLDRSWALLFARTGGLFVANYQYAFRAPALKELYNNEAKSECSAWLCFVAMGQSYDHFSSRVPFFQILNRRGDLTQAVTPVDDRRYLSGLHELTQDGQVFSAEVSGIRQRRWIPMRNGPARGRPKRTFI